MILSKFYCNKKIKNVSFREDLNIIVAKVTEPANLEKDSHNLGKTTLAHMLNFMLLGSIEDVSFLKNSEIFKEYTFYLEIKTNSYNFITIRRSAAHNTKISFKFHQEKDQDYSNLDDSEWDILDTPIDRAVKHLNQMLNFNVLSNWSYRKTVGYFIRTQQDYQDVFQLFKYSSGEHKEWKPFIFELLGFKADIIKEKYELDECIEELNQDINEIKTEYTIKIEDYDKLKGILQMKENEKKSLSEEIDNFNFYQKERNINQELVETIEKEIAELNSVEYQIKYEIDKVKSSLMNKLKFNIEDIKTLYEEVKLYFPEELLHEYEKLIKFNKAVSTERNKHLRQTLSNLEDKLERIHSELKDLNLRRQKSLKNIKDQDTFSKFKSYQKELAQKEAEIIENQNRLEKIEKLINIQEDKESKQEQLKSYISKIRKSIQDDNEVYNRIRQSFTNYVKEITGYSAILSIRLNGEGNPEYIAEFTEGTDETEFTSKARGNSYKKILCAAFDLALMTEYSDKDFFKFIYHDGVYEALDNRKKIKFRNLVERLVKEYNFQYIYTLLEDDSIRNIKGSDSKEELNSENIVLELDDSGPEGKLFMIDF